MVTIAQGCRAYLCIADVVMMAAGSLLLLFALYMLAAKSAVQELNALDEVTWKLNIGLLVVGTLLIWTGIVGFMFASAPRNKVAGISYLAVVLLGLLIQFVLLWAVLSKLHLVDEIDNDEAQSKVAQYQNDVLAKTFGSYAKRLQRSDMGCEFVEPGTEEHHDPYDHDSFFPDEEDLDVYPFMARLLDDTTDHGEQCLNGPKLKCKMPDAEKAFSCTAKPTFEDHFKELCSKCFNTFGDKHLEKSKYWENVKAYWEDPNIQLSWCRCYGRIMDSVSRHSETILKVVLLYMVLQLLLLVSVVIQLLFPASVDPDGEDVWLEMSRRS